MKKLFYALFMLLVLTSSSCKKEDEEIIPTISMERVGNTKESFIVPGQSNFLIYEFQITSLVDVEISEIQLSIKAGKSLVNNVDFLIVINDIAQGMEPYYGKEVTFRIEDLILKSPENLVVKIYSSIHDSVTKGESISVSLGSINAVDMSRATVTSYTKPLGGPVFTIR